MISDILGYFGYVKVTKEAVLLAMQNQMLWKQLGTSGMSDSQRVQTRLVALTLTNYLRSCRGITAGHELRERHNKEVL